MRFVPTAIAFLLGSSGLVTVACSSGSSDDSANTPEDGTTPATDATTTEPTPAPAQSPSRAIATPTPPKAPTFTPGNWTAGEAVAEVSGGVSVTVRGTLNNQASSDRQTTRLIYVAGLDTISISISTAFQAFAMSVFSPNPRVSVQSHSTQSCEATYTETTDKRIAGSFRCPNARISLGGSGEALIEGTFTATR